MSTNEIKILYMVSSLRKCGPTNQLFGLIKNLDRDQFKARVLTLSKEGENSMLGDFLSLGIEVVSAESPKLLAHFKGKRAFKQTVRDFYPDIIHTSGFRPDFFADKWREYARHCATIRGYAYEDYPVEFGKLKGFFMAGFHLRTLSRVQYPICCSYAVAEKLQIVHHLKSSVIQNGVDMDRYPPGKPNAKDSLRNKLALPLDKRIYVFSGLLIERKEPVQLMKAFIESKIQKEAALVILGDGPLFKVCRDMANHNILIRGHVDNVPDYLHASDIFVSASNSEGLPNAVMEAMSTGLPVLLSDIQPHKEILLCDSDAGAVFKTGNIPDLSDQFVQSLSWDIQRMGLKAKSIVENRLNAAIMSRNYQKLYLKMIENKEHHRMRVAVPDINSGRIGSL